MTERRWRDGKGLVHALERHDAYYINTFGVVSTWTPRCGYPRKSDKIAQHAAPVTCLVCMGKASHVG